jgi:ribosomal protein L20A (L18A)
MKAYRISGTMKMGLVKDHPFKIEIPATDKDAAVDKAYAILGSRHGAKRSEIKIKEVKALKNEEIEDSSVKYAVTGE